jgi:pimeloyl-ACP methyl ester carboxylesterase
LPEETVILIHGIWTNGLDMCLLKNRLGRAGFYTRIFSYPSVRSSPSGNASDLQNFTERISSPVLHYVCHSLGGLIIRHLFHNYPEQRPGRVVTLGTPHNTSSAAKQLSQSGTGRFLLGHSIVGGLLGEVPPWCNSHEIGVIAGKLRLGLGMFVPGIPQPSDGTVAVAETRLDGMTDHIVLPVSHFGMLLSRQVVKQARHFLRHGCFQGEHQGGDFTGHRA